MKSEKDSQKLLFIIFLLFLFLFIILFLWDF